MATKVKKEGAAPTIKKDELAQILVDSLNKEFKENGQVAYFLGDNENPDSIHEWISTGSSLLDIAISNRKNCGLPVGRLTEIAGLESSGKTLVGAHILAETQKKGGIGVFIETENSLDNTFLNAVGVDTSTNFVHVVLDAIEDVLAAVEAVVVKIRETQKDRLVTIVVDSIAGASTKTEIEGDYDKAGYNTAKAIILSQGLRKLMPMIARQRVCLVFINQLRDKVGTLLMPGMDKYTTPGGKAIPFHASVRIRLKSAGKIKADINGVPQVIGVKSIAEVVKNKLGPAYSKAEYEVYYDSGIDDLGGWLEACKKYGIVSQSGKTYQYIDKTSGEVIKCSSKEWYELLNTKPDIKNQIYDAMCEMLIMDYAKVDKIGIDEITIDTNDPIVD